MAANGQVKINKSHWFVHYNRASQPVAGPYESVRQARGMASLLAHFDWTKNVEDFSEGEIREISYLTQSYRQELEIPEIYCKGQQDIEHPYWLQCSAL